MHRSKIFPLLLALCAAAGLWGTAHAQTWGSTQVRLWGGRDGRNNLGCLTCEATLPDALLGPTASPNLIFAGIRDYSDGNPCTMDARDPPALVDDQGGYYGRFSQAFEYGHADSVCSPTSVYHSLSVCRLVRALCLHQPISQLGFDPRRNLYFGKCDDGHKLTSIQNDGQVVIIDGTTAYRVNPTDASRVINGWFTDDPINLCPGEEMVNVRRKQTVQAAVAPFPDGR